MVPSWMSEAKEMQAGEEGGDYDVGGGRYAGAGYPMGGQAA